MDSFDNSVPIDESSTELLEFESVTESSLDESVTDSIEENHDSFHDESVTDSADSSNCDVFEAVTPYDDSSLIAVVSDIAKNTSTINEKLTDINNTQKYTLQAGMLILGVVDIG